MMTKDTTTRNIVCLISGRGSNLDALLAAARDERWAESLDARIACVISNKAEAAGLAKAQAAGVPTQVLPHTRFASREAFDTALMQAIDAHRPSLVVLAGFMRVLTREFVAHYRGRLVNVHPSLLPSFPGLATHRQALAAGVRVHGATVHFVSTEVDGGAIIGQAVVPVRADDSEESLAARVLTQEHRLLPRCVRLLLEGAITLTDGRAQVAPGRDAELAVAAW
jgi:phosphoribosylglycinamide formyltransferase-1